MDSTMRADIVNFPTLPRLNNQFDTSLQSCRKPNLLRRVYDWMLSLAERKLSGLWLGLISLLRRAFSQSLPMFY